MCKKLTIESTAKILSEHGYTLGHAETGLENAIWITRYPVTYPNGKVFEMIASAVAELVNTLSEPK